MSFEQKIVAPDAKRTQLWMAAVLSFALLAAVFPLGRFLVDGAAAVRFPWELDYGEGIVWEQMRLMVAGRGYGAIDELPAIVFHYPPVFHMITAVISGATGLDQLAVGRSVSIGSTLFMALFAALIAAKTVRADDPLRISAVCGLIAGLSCFCILPIANWAPLMRVDMLSIALSFAGLLVAMAALTRPALIVASALLFVTAVFTKQTSIVAPAAVFLTFLLLRPRLAWHLAASCVVIGLFVLGALVLATDGGFVRHIILFNANRFDAARLPFILLVIITHCLFVTAVVIGVVTRLHARLPLYRGAGSVAVLRQRLIDAPGDAFFLLILVYALLSFLTTFGIAKSGSHVNYFIEWMAVLAILLGIVTREAVSAAFGGVQAPSKRLFSNPIFLPLLIGLQAVDSGPPTDYTKQRSATRVAELETLRAMVRSAPRPVISDDMVLLVRAGVPVQWEPAIFAELASMGTWDEAPFVERVKAGHFAFFVTVGVRGEELFDSRYNPAVADAMYAAYPVRREIAGYTIHLPVTAAR